MSPPIEQSKRPSTTAQELSDDTSSDSDGGSISEWQRLRKKMPRTASLGYEVERLLKRQEFHDVTVRCGDRDHPCNRVAMAARSEVFRAMLAGSFTETNSRVIELHGVESQIVENLTQYITTDSCDLLSQYPNVEIGSVIALLRAADQYHIRGLLFLCQEVVAHLVTPECLMDVLNLAQELNCVYLRAKCYEQLRNLSGDELLMQIEGKGAVMPINLELPDSSIKQVLVKPNLSVEELKIVAAREPPTISEINRKYPPSRMDEEGVECSLQGPRLLRLVVGGVPLKDSQQLVDAIPTSETYRTSEQENMQSSVNNSVLNVKVQVKSPRYKDSKKSHTQLRMLC